MYKKYLIDIGKRQYEELVKMTVADNQIKNVERDMLIEFYNKFTEISSINGIDQMNELFPIDDYDIFISHSHKNIEEARALKNFLEMNLNLKVFIDCDFWQSADDFLKELDNLYCIKDNGFYSYEKRNITTSHIHVMLSISIIKAIQSSEIVFFVGSSDFSSEINGDSLSGIKSPWIFLEAYLSTIMIEIPKRLSQRFVDESFQHKQSKGIDIRYNLDIKDLKKINITKLEKWHKMYLVEKYKSLGEKKNTLDLLYILLGETKSES
jgi:hypothetical protein